MKQVYVGMDLGSKHCAAVAVDSRGKMVDSEVFKTGERNMISFLERLKGSAWVMIEEGELASWVARTIRPHVEKVVVSDPRRNAWVAKAGNKNDQPLNASRDYATPSIPPQDGHEPPGMLGGNSPPRHILQ